MVMDESGMMYLTRWRRTPKRRDDFEGDRSSGFSLHQTKHTQEKRRLKSILGSISHNILSLSSSLALALVLSLSLALPVAPPFFQLATQGTPSSHTLVFAWSRHSVHRFHLPHAYIKVPANLYTALVTSVASHHGQKKNRLQRPPLYQKRLEQVTECQSNWLMKHPI
jgi:hypothetical protein